MRVTKETYLEYPNAVSLVHAGSILSLTTSHLRNLIATNKIEAIITATNESLLDRDVIKAYGKALRPEQFVLPGKITAGIKSGLVTRDDNKCVYCGKPKTTGIDHIIPESRGGTCEIANLVTCCRVCNSKKGNQTPSEVGMKLPFPLNENRFIGPMTTTRGHIEIPRLQHRAWAKNLQPGDAVSVVDERGLGSILFTATIDELYASRAYIHDTATKEEYRASLTNGIVHRHFNWRIRPINSEHA